MALILADRVRETSASTGTGALTLGGSSAGFQTFQIGIGNLNTTYYALIDSNIAPTYWEVGLGTYTALNNTLSRDTIYSSSSGVRIDIPPGSLSFVYCDLPGSRVVTPQVVSTLLAAGSNITLAVDQNFVTTINSSGGGGGGSFASSAIWSGGTTNKNAYISPGVVNTVGITINLVASSGAGGITAAVVALNSVNLPGTYASTGNWPNLVITIPSSALINNAAEVATNVSISLTGTFGGSGVNVANAGSLTNNQPIPFATILSGGYGVANAPFYTTTETLNYSYSNSNAITTFGGVFNPGGNATSPSGSFANTVITGSNISGSATGTGQFGAGSSTVSLAGSVAALPTYVPAFYVQTANSTVPTFTTASAQTPGGATGSLITYPVATLRSMYNFIAVDAGIALSRIMFVTPFGNAPLVPDVGPVATTIASRNFTIYGFTRLDTISAAQLMITA